MAQVNDTAATTRPRAALLLAAAVAVAALLLSPAVAQAGVSAWGSLSVTPWDNVAVPSDLAATLTVKNANAAPDEPETQTLTSLRVAPSCGASLPIGGDICDRPDDPGVFALSSATGAPGTACAGRTFAISAADASGAHTLTTPTPVILQPPGGAAGSDHCTVAFAFAAVRLPTIDAGSRPGVQTNFNLAATVINSPSNVSLAIDISVELTLIDPDGDGDALPDAADNCPLVPNPGQANLDADAHGDACDADDDNDGVLDVSDTCPGACTPPQTTPTQTTPVQTTPIQTTPNPTGLAVTFHTQRLSQVRRRGFRARAGCDRACRVDGRLELGAARARQLGLRSRVVASGFASATPGGRAPLVLKLTSRARRAFGRLRSVKLTLVCTPSNAAGKGPVNKRSVTLRR